MTGSAEHDLIDRHFRPLATPPGAFRLLDDAAVYTPPPGIDLVLTNDGIAEGVHFLAGEAADVVARKALRANLSDLAAKGATPVGYLLMLALSQTCTEQWIVGFASGLAADQRDFGVSLYGGDTIRSESLLVSVTAFGTVPSGRTVRRGGAGPGDLVYVSGTIGDGALGLLVARDDPRVAALAGPDRARLLDRYRLPRPRVQLATAVSQYASAALDVSDGLAGDLDRLCRVSGLSASVSTDRVPLSHAAGAAVAADTGLLPLCLTGGDDYEILCTVPPARARAFEAAAAAAGVPVSCIGATVEGEGDADFLDRNGEVLDLGRRAFSHVDDTYSPS